MATTTIGQPVKFKGKKIVAKKKNGGTAAGTAARAAAAAAAAAARAPTWAVDTAAPKSEEDNLKDKIEKEIKAGNFDACLGLDETTNVYVVAFDDGYHVAAIKKDRVIDLIGSRSGSDNDAYVTAINLGVAWIAKQ